jgi:hypothetical protein
MSLKYKEQHERRRNINQTHNPKVEGSNPSPATNIINQLRKSERAFPDLLTNRENPKAASIIIFADASPTVLIPKPERHSENAFS